MVFLFTTRRFKESSFDEIDGGVILNDEGKRTLITELNAKLDEPKQHKGKMTQNRNIILADMHRVAKRLTKR